MYLNQIVLIGRVEHPVVTGSSSAGDWCKFTIKTAQKTKDKAGNWVEIPTLHTCLAVDFNYKKAAKLTPNQLVTVQGLYLYSEKSKGMYVKVHTLQSLYSKRNNRNANAYTDAPV